MSRARSVAGQAVAEFALTIIVFLVILMGVVDFGMAIYKFNGVSQAARELARVTSVHPCAVPGALTCAPGGSTETQNVLATQKGLIPGLELDPSNPIGCVDETGMPANPCDFSKHSVQVVVIAEYQPVTPLLGLTGPWEMKGSSSAQIQ